MAIQNIQGQPAIPLAAESAPPKPAPLTVATPKSTPTNQNQDQVQLNTRSGNIPQHSISLVSQPPAKFDPIAAGKLNTTKNYSKANMPVSIKEALAPTIRILEAVDPEMAASINALDESDFGLAADGMTDMFAKHDIYAAWVAVAREQGTAKLHFSDMILDDRFWKMNDAQKASVLSHEMVHANDTPIISHFEKLFGSISNKINGIEWGDPVEDRAYLYQYNQFEKLGIDKSGEIFWTAQTYLEDRGLVEPYKF